MARRPNRRREPTDANALLYGAGIALLVVMVGLYFCAAWIAARTDSITPDELGRRRNLLAALVSGHFRPSGTFWLLLLSVLVLLVLLGGVLAWALPHLRGSEKRWVDPLAKSMSGRDDLTEMEETAAKADAQRLGALETAGLGPALGKSVLRKRWLHGSWEWTQCWIMGPRAGKTSCVAVPQILETSGPVLATSNKRDIVDLTRRSRATRGRVWVQDPQQLAEAPASWWWNPLSYATDMERADELAGLWAASVSSADARRDAYFDSAAQRLLAELIFAAALGDEPITRLGEWLAQPDRFLEPDNPNRPSPVTILHEHGHTAVATSLDGTLHLTPKQRDGVMGTAIGMVSFLRSERVLPWIMRPSDGEERAEFSPAAFVRSTDTIYLLSREGAGSARAITAALTVAVTRAGEEYATTQSGGRLRTPLLCILDECANVVRWPELPNLFSHYGSRGIVLVAIFQSWAQMVGVWGKDGAEKLWGASNVRGIGRGLADPEHLRGLEQLIGIHDVIGKTRNSGEKLLSNSHSEHLRQESIMTVRDIAALPGGRAVVFSSGHAPALVELVHYGDRLDRRKSGEGAVNPFLSGRGSDD